jgi:uncharacterized protein (DUF2235 family)
MPRNLVIFSDGTGQQGGIFFDERRSNIYKLYRASRCGPDSTINPAEQLAYYDPGLGSGTARFWRRLYNLISQATGLGLTPNIIDCYAYIIQNWQPGDRIFLFGFSRGAYTVRCLATVLTKCGVPTRTTDGTRLYRDPKTARAIATEAVKKVYQYVLSSREKKKYVDHREELARHFRERYASDANGKSNALPHFIGVFDTVAALGSREFVAIALGVLVLIFLAISGVAFCFTGEFWRWFVYLLLGTTLLAILVFLLGLTRIGRRLRANPLWRTFHFGLARYAYYDESLTVDIPFARHALSIDENRATFDRVPWGEKGVWPRAGWLKQMWFAGNHSDIGGSYAENESRLSDIALGWMVDEAREAGLNVDDSVLRLYPSIDGVEHDECKSSIFRFARQIARSLKTDAPLHPSVIERLKLSEVMNYSTTAPYRPTGLRAHRECMHFYDADDLIAEFGLGAAAEAQRRAGLPPDEENKKPDGYWDRLLAEIERRKVAG